MHSAAKPARRRDRDDDSGDPKRCFQHNYHLRDVKAIHKPRNGCAKCLGIYRKGVNKS